MDETLDRLIQSAREGQLSKADLAELLDPEARPLFLDACAAIEKQYTEECRTAGEPCLTSGCSIEPDQGEVCLQPLVRAGSDYSKACAAVWIPLFLDPRNRSAWWRHAPIVAGLGTEIGAARPA